MPFPEESAKIKLYHNIGVVSPLWCKTRKNTPGTIEAEYLLKDYCMPGLDGMGGKQQTQRLSRSFILKGLKIPALLS